MNTLSWLLYFADVLYTQTSYFYFLVVITPFVYFAYRTIQKIASENLWSWDTDKIREAKIKEQESPFILNWKFIYVPLIMLLLLNFIPSKETFYLIVGSEAGEYVVNTPEAKEIFNNIKEVIHLQLEELRGDSKGTD